MFPQFHNVINTTNHVQHIITDNGINNLRKVCTNDNNRWAGDNDHSLICQNQVDGADDGSSDDEESDFVNVSEVDPQSVRAPMSNVPATPTIFKKETKEEETDDDLVEEEIDNMHHTNISIKNEDSEDDNEDSENEGE